MALFDIDDPEAALGYRNIREAKYPIEAEIKAGLEALWEAYKPYADAKFVHEVCISVRLVSFPEGFQPSFNLSLDWIFRLTNVSVSECRFGIIDVKESHGGISGVRRGQKTGGQRRRRRLSGE